MRHGIFSLAPGSAFELRKWKCLKTEKKEKIKKKRE
jgi:hypothetical protein